MIAKIEEEVAELRETLDGDPQNTARAEEEMGDLLFAIANLSRKLGIEPEAALRKANDKFTGRFNQLEQNFTASGRTLEAAPLEEMEAEWTKIKATEYTRTRRSTKGSKIHEERTRSRFFLSQSADSGRRSSSGDQPAILLLSGKTSVARDAVALVP